MRRLLLVFLLLVFPIQVTWAAVCVYCPDGCVVESNAGTRPGTVPAAKADDSAKANSISLEDSDCTCCFLGGVGLAARTLEAAVVKPHEALAPSAGTVFFSSIRPERPERPKWPRAA